MLWYPLLVDYEFWHIPLALDYGIPSIQMNQQISRKKFHSQERQSLELNAVKDTKNCSKKLEKSFES